MPPVPLRAGSLEAESGQQLGSSGYPSTVPGNGHAIRMDGTGMQ